MMKFFSLPILLFFSFSTFAQNHLIGIKGGVCWSNIHSKEVSTDAFRTGFTVGLTYENRIKQNLLIGGELLYQQRGYKVFLQFSDDFGNIINSSDKTKDYYDYISVPLKVGYVAGNKLSGYVNVGLVPSILIKAESILPDFFISNTLDMKGYAKKFDLAGLVEIGGNMQVSERLAISVSCSYQHSFTDYNKQETFLDIKVRHYAIILSGGLKYTL